MSTATVIAIAKNSNEMVRIALDMYRGLRASACYLVLDKPN